MMVLPDTNGTLVCKLEHAVRERKGSSLDCKCKEGCHQKTKLELFVVVRVQGNWCPYLQTFLPVVHSPGCC